MASAGICTDFSSGYPDTAAQTYCTNASGTYSASSACATTGRVGSCAITSSGYTITQRYYSPNTSASAQSACTGSSGTYTAN